ncbi:MAG: PIN domain-containing protein [Fimbriimonadaceae bacterium]|nr:PIN domain-containing protein [Fimbriimonadaceae bacterium]
MKADAAVGGSALTRLELARWAGVWRGRGKDSGIAMAKIRKLLFVDTNILLDFYRVRNEAGLGLLRHLDETAASVISTFQLEMEFKKNRQAAIQDGWNELKAPAGIQRPGLFSDAKAVKAIQSSQKAIDRRVKSLRDRFSKALRDPSKHDPVYKVCQRLFHKGDALSLTREDTQRHAIRRKALKRFLLGCPPRKRNDTSIGDAVNWEWMVHCAKSQNAELVIVSRDSDFGAVIDGVAYINDHLKQEFAERVSKKRKVLLYHKLSDALKHFDVKVTKAEEQEEESIAQPIANQVRDFQTYVDALLEKSRGQVKELTEKLRGDEVVGALLADVLKQGSSGPGVGLSEDTDKGLAKKK